MISEIRLVQRMDMMWRFDVCYAVVGGGWVEYVDLDGGGSANDPESNVGKVLKMISQISSINQLQHLTFRLLVAIVGNQI